jgi:hypothetical protein
MKIRHGAAAALLAAAGAFLFLAETPARTRSPQDPRETLEQLSWMAGDWVGTTTEGATWEAMYSDARGGEILSLNKELRGDKLLMHEFERFHVAGDAVVMVPHPFGKASVPFTLVDFDPKEKRARFVNESHDFPKDILYERKGKDRFVITVKGDQNGQAVELVLDLKARD